MPSYRDIDQYYHPGDSGVDIGWAYLEEWVQRETALGLELEPDFQRGHVWTDAQRSAYLEQVLRHGMVNTIVYVNRGPWGWRKPNDSILHLGQPPLGQPLSWEGEIHHVLVDGLQRITAVRMFMANQIAVMGALRSEWEGALPLHARLRFVIGNLRTRADVLRWYLSLNSTGVIHSQAELDRVREMLNDPRSLI